MYMFMKINLKKSHFIHYIHVYECKFVDQINTNCSLVSLKFSTTLYNQIFFWLFKKREELSALNLDYFVLSEKKKTFLNKFKKKCLNLFFKIICSSEIFCHLNRFGYYVKKIKKIIFECPKTSLLHRKISF